MEIKFTLDGEVSVNKVVQGLRGTGQDAMLIGRNIFSADARDFSRITLNEDVR